MSRSDNPPSDMVERVIDYLLPHAADPVAAELIDELHDFSAAITAISTDGWRDALVAERLLASIWFYGGFKAETHNERLLQQHMERVGMWPIASEADLFAKIDSALSANRIEEGVGE